MATKKPQLEQSETVDALPLACVDENAARALIEHDRWGDCPCCPHCGDTKVYRMAGSAAEKRGLWRCHGCKKQFTVRVGSIFEDSKSPLRIWCRAMWEATSCKAGISALELSRKVQVSYKSALFMMHRIRHAMNPGPDTPKLSGTVEADETYVGGKPRYRGSVENPINKRGRGTTKQPVAAVLARGGDVRVRVIPVVNSHNLREMLRDHVDTSSRVMTDKESGYRGTDREFASHETVDHGRREYVRGDVTTNGVEGFFARVKRGLNGVYHSVSREHLHRYMDQFAYMHNARKLNDGERFSALVRGTSGKRLFYRKPTDAA